MSLHASFLESKVRANHALLAWCPPEPVAAGLASNWMLACLGSEGTVDCSCTATDCEVHGPYSNEIVGIQVIAMPLLYDWPQSPYTT